MHEKSENRKALPKFLLVLLVSGLGGGIIGFIVGISNVFGLDTASVAAGVNELLRAVTPWAIPVSAIVTLGGSLLLYRSAARQYSAWNGGDEDAAAKRVDFCLNWVLLLGMVQLLVSLFFFAAASYYELSGILYYLAVFLVSMALVIFSQQKVVDLIRRMNPEKQGSIYDMKFQKKWLETCDEEERQQIGQAAFHAYSLTSRVCLWLWVLLVILNLVFEIGMMPVCMVLVVMAVMQVSYMLECIRMENTPHGPGWRR